MGTDAYINVNVKYFPPLSPPFRMRCIVVPTEDGLVNVPLEEFGVVVAGGQVVLVAEENPLLLLVGVLLGGGAGIGTGAATVTGLKMAGLAVGPKATKTIIATSSALGALVGGAAAPRPAPALP
ncbi:MAG: hypothetical protein DDT18_01897 [Actinobacteria bacterium]|nr:hypothetical protein [Actinomycetota bacterium]